MDLPESTRVVGEAPGNSHHQKEDGRYNQTGLDEWYTSESCHEKACDDGARNTKRYTQFNHHRNFLCRHTSLHKKVWTVCTERSTQYLGESIAIQDDSCTTPIGSLNAVDEPCILRFDSVEPFFFIERNDLLQSRRGVRPLVGQPLQCTFCLFDLALANQPVR